MIEWAGEDDVDEVDLARYAPGRGRAPRLRVTSSAGGIIATVRLDDGKPTRTVPGEVAIAAHQPTRYALALRRQAANRIRRSRSEPPLPDVYPGDCAPCSGWGVVGPRRSRCERCNGRGEV